MCFYNDDYDWTAAIWEVSTIVAESDYKCMECGTTISKGEFHRYTYQQESESCTVCEDDWHANFQEKGYCEDNGEKHNYGETYEHRICRNCCKILTAIDITEEAEGCPPFSRQPALSELHEAMNPYMFDDAPKYAAKAVELWPELATNSMIKQAMEPVG